MPAQQEADQQAVAYEASQEYVEADFLTTSQAGRGAAALSPASLVPNKPRYYNMHMSPAVQPMVPRKPEAGQLQAPKATQSGVSALTVHTSTEPPAGFSAPAAGSGSPGSRAQASPVSPSGYAKRQAQGRSTNASPSPDSNSPTRLRSSAVSPVFNSCKESFVRMGSGKAGVSSSYNGVRKSQEQQRGSSSAVRSSSQLQTQSKDTTGGAATAAVRRGSTTSASHSSTLDTRHISTWLAQKDTMGSRSTSTAPRTAAAGTASLRQSGSYSKPRPLTAAQQQLLATAPPQLATAARAASPRRQSYTGPQGSLTYSSSLNSSNSPVSTLMTSHSTNARPSTAPGSSVVFSRHSSSYSQPRLSQTQRISATGPELATARRASSPRRLSCTGPLSPEPGSPNNRRLLQQGPQQQQQVYSTAYLQRRQSQQERQERQQLGQLATAMMAVAGELFGPQAPSPSNRQRRRTSEEERERQQQREQQWQQPGMPARRASACRTTNSSSATSPRRTRTSQTASLDFGYAMISPPSSSGGMDYGSSSGRAAAMAEARDAAAGRSVEATAERERQLRLEQQWQQPGGSAIRRSSAGGSPLHGRPSQAGAAGASLANGTGSRHTNAGLRTGTSAAPVPVAAPAASYSGMAAAEPQLHIRCASPAAAQQQQQQQQQEQQQLLASPSVERLLASCSIGLKALEGRASWLLELAQEARQDVDCEASYTTGDMDHDAEEDCNAAAAAAAAAACEGGGAMTGDKVVAEKGPLSCLAAELSEPGNLRAWYERSGSGSQARRSSEDA